MDLTLFLLVVKGLTLYPSNKCRFSQHIQLLTQTEFLHKQKENTLMFSFLNEALNNSLTEPLLSNCNLYFLNRFYCKCRCMIGRYKWKDHYCMIRYQPLVR